MSAQEALAREKSQRIKAAAEALGGLVALFMRSSEHNRYSIADLEWLLLPAVINRQHLIVRAPRAGDKALVPAAAIMWASVSDEYDQLFRQNLGQRYQLTAEMRRSGENAWITDTVGEPLLCERALVELRRTALKDRKLALVRRQTDGTPLLIEHPAE
jgi:hemolysin-activating ACP:hemolysin acyltransferase